MYTLLTIHVNQKLHTHLILAPSGAYFMGFANGPQT